MVVSIEYFGGEDHNKVEFLFSFFHYAKIKKILEEKIWKVNKNERKRWR